MLNKKTQFKAFPKYPSVERDLALVMDKSVTNGETVRYIKKFSDKSLTDVSIFDIYEGDQMPQGKKSMAYHLTFSLLDRSLTQEEVDANVNKILSGLKNVGIELR
jgi:phenylalanyl-tRNA synthetase beta chain